MQYHNPRQPVEITKAELVAGDVDGLESSLMAFCDLASQVAGSKP